ncbi:hypothetical protein GGG16DRAFT_67295 [Schizophyllum commune]
MNSCVVVFSLVRLRADSAASSCDRLNIDGTVKPASENTHSWGQAQKMRASATFMWGHICGLGTLPWHENDAGEKIGNPSISPIVSRYMVSLRKRKTRAGEVATSARALTAVYAHALTLYKQENLWELYHLNMDERKFPLNKQYTGPTRRGTNDEKDQWAGAKQRRMLSCIYILAFLCLLRSDEVLNIRVEDIERDKFDDDKWTLHLNFRKTAQYGGELCYDFVHVQQFTDDIQRFNHLFFGGCLSTSRTCVLCAPCANGCTSRRLRADIYFADSLQVTALSRKGIVPWYVYLSYSSLPL